MAPVLAFLTASLVAQAQPPELTPTEIYERCVAAVERLDVPKYVAFTIEGDSTQTFRTLKTGDEQAIGPQPNGPQTNGGQTNVQQMGAAQTNPQTNGPQPNDEQTQLDDALDRVLVRLSDSHTVVVPLKDLNGAPVARPAPLPVVGQDFGPITRIWAMGAFATADPGLRDRLTGIDFFNPSAAPAPTSTSGPPIIAKVYSVNPPPYRIVDLGDTAVDGHAAYHLRLTPIRDPDRRRLRELWIDKTTMLPVRYIVDRYVGDQPPFTYLATVDTGVIDNHLVNLALSGTFLRTVLRTSIYGVSSWHVSDVSFPAQVPDWVFDAKQWNHHIGEPIPGLAPTHRDISALQR